MTTTVERPKPAGEQSRAVYPRHTGYVEREGVRTFYEVYGEGDETVFLMPTWSLVHSRAWKGQIGHLSRYYRVVTFDPRGNGKSDRPGGRDAYTEHELMLDALAVLDATDTRSAVVVASSKGVQRAMLLAVTYPERVSGLVLIGPYFVGTRKFMYMIRAARATFDRKPLTTAWKFKFNGRYMNEQTDPFIDWFSRQALNPPHSTKQIEDMVGWAKETSGAAIAESWMGDLATEISVEAQREFASKIRCPTLVISSESDEVTLFSEAKALAGVLGCDMVNIGDGGHLPHVRKPAEVNRLLSDFCLELLGPGRPQAKSVRSKGARKKVLFVSSPIGLGHARRDLAVATSLREQDPEVEVEWFTQHPVTAMLERENEKVHPATEYLALESAHLESECGEHDLHCFQAFRRMDEILIHNYMIFQDVVADGGYRAVVGDEAWDVDYYSHEHPTHKKTKYVWMTDFVGWLPIPEGGPQESFLTSDYNAEMIGHVEGNPDVRDRAIYVGRPDDLVPDTFGPGLPAVREWTQQHYDFAGYVTGFDPRTLGDRDELRAEFGYRPDERVCIVSVGGSGVGLPLLRRIAEAVPLARTAVPDLRVVMVAGPRIDRRSLEPQDGLEVHEYVHGLHRHFAAADMAIVQGGLTTTMELTATGVPFIYFPLENHFEQQFWVRHRLERYRAGISMAYSEANHESIAAAIAANVGAVTDYVPVETDGAFNAARMIAEVLN